MVKILSDRGSNLTSSRVARTLRLYKLMEAATLKTLLIETSSLVTLEWLRLSKELSSETMIGNGLSPFTSPIATRMCIGFWQVCYGLVISICYIIGFALVFPVLAFGLLVILVASVFVPLALCLWLYIYLIPVYDVILPRLQAWMLARNASIYQPLPNGASPGDVHIRLIRLKPGQGKDPIKCELSQCLLSSASFDAISYVWGTSIIPHRITVDGRPFYVTANLYTALQHLRHAKEDRLLWIDAIAINQADRSEKGSQVLMMRDIYGRASKVVIWMGRASQTTYAAFRLARSLAHASNDERQALWAQNTTGKPGSQIEKEWADILYQEWWTRSWIIQEVVAGEEVVILRGDLELEWEAVHDFVNTARLHEAPYLDTDTALFCEYVDKLRANPEATDDSVNTLFHLVLRFRNQSATLGCDKIYSLQGLLPPSTPISLVPDYSKSAHEVFVDFTVACIESRKDLVTLAVAEGGQINDISWCRNWSIDNDGEAHVLNWFSLPRPGIKAYNASGGQPVVYSVDIQRHVLTLRGFAMGTIVKCTTVCHAVSHRIHQIRWASTLQMWQSKMGGPWQNDTKSRRSFNRTITADQWIEDEWETHFLDRGPFENKLQNEDFKKRLEAACVNRLCYKTDRGNFGLAPSKTKEGDVVVILLGSPVPFVLRPMSKKQLVGSRTSLRSNDREYFKLVGETYADGLMHYSGDIAEDAARGQIRLQDYTLL